ncbi:MAG: tRNA threonylcarbamoyladenosine dehydratase [Selenomonadaceae bacterium]|nr:tRNA threonylcarbamoyladenosine dehydratase [Selenomonadaceae bacterium]
MTDNAFITSDAFITDNVNDAFDRIKRLIGAENFLKLNSATVAIFGIGGVGSFTAEALARSGIGHLILIDKDNIDVTNINRQIHALNSTVGKSKVEVMRNRILDINPAAKVDAVQKFYLPDENADSFFICRYDYVVDAIDTITAKINLAAECQRRNIPLISSMGAGNKLDPTRFKIADIFKTSTDPVAKVMRRKLKEIGVKNLKCVYSDEVPRSIDSENLIGKVIGSTAFVPSVAGLIIAAEVVKDLISR